MRAESLTHLDPLILPLTLLHSPTFVPNHVRGDLDPPCPDPLPSLPTLVWMQAHLGLSRARVSAVGPFVFFPVRSWFLQDDLGVVAVPAEAEDAAAGEEEAAAHAGKGERAIDAFLQKVNLIGTMDRNVL